MATIRDDLQTMPAPRIRQGKGSRADGKTVGVSRWLGPSSGSHRGFTRTDLVVLIVVGAVGVLLAWAFLMPSLIVTREIPTRAICSVNVRSLIQSMIIYAQDNNNEFPAASASSSDTANRNSANQMFPAASGPAGDTYVNDSHITTSDTAATPKAAATAAYGTGVMVASPLASMWLLVLNGQMTVKSFLCPSDPYATQPSEMYNASSQYFYNFGVVNGATSATGIGESYSIDFPWCYRTGKIGGWWMNNTSSSLPLAADMAPAYDPKGGRLARDPLLPLNNFAGNYIFNSGNHAGQGQNVGFGDDHVVWENNPYVGQSSDSIYSYGNISSDFPTDGAMYCGSTGDSAVYHHWNPGKAKSWDVWMAPVRDVRNGHW